MKKCKHHWILEEEKPERWRTSGICRKCGRRRQFSPYLERPSFAEKSGTKELTLSSQGVEQIRDLL